MGLTVKDVTYGSDSYPAVKRLYNDTFRDHDGVPMWTMMLKTRRKYVTIQAYYDGDLFCGMSVVLTDPDVFYILYLAVDPDLRSKGYGSRILSILDSRSEGRNVVLDIEDPYEECGDPDVRRRRLGFYLRNGFVETEYKYFDKEGKYLILSESGDASRESLYRLLKKLSFGFYRADIRKDVRM